MVERLICLACLVIGYGFGLIQIAHIYSRAKNINIREKGSGNAGTTNMFRVMGIRAGIITLIGDCGKTVAAIVLTRLVFITGLHFNIDPTALALYAGFGTVLGHNFPFYSHFKGGKGVATTAAMLCSLGSWQLILFGVIIFFGTVVITQYVSLGSILLAIGSLIEFIIFTQVGWMKVDSSWLVDCYVIFVIFTALLIFQHRKNIVRLKNHEENKFFFRTSKQIKESEAQHRETQANAKVQHVHKKANKKVDKLQAKASKVERKVDKKVDKLQAKTTKVEAKMERVQNKAIYKEKKVQLKAEFKNDVNRNWAGKIADYAPKSLRQRDEEE